MHTHPTFKEHHNRCMKQWRAPQAQLQSLAGMYGVLLTCLRPVHSASVQVVALYGSQLWWDPTNGSWRDDLHLILNWLARSTLGMLLANQRGAQMRDPGLTPAAVALNAQHQWFVPRLASTCEGSKSTELLDYPTPRAPVGRMALIDHSCGRRAETMCWPDPGEEPAIKTTILEDDTMAKRAAALWV